MIMGDDVGYNRGRLLSTYFRFDGRNRVLSVFVYCCWCVGGLILFKGLTNGNDLFSRSLLLAILLVIKLGGRTLELVK